MKMRWIKSGLVLMAMSCSFAATAEERGDWLGYYWGHHGTYVAELDLNPLGIPRIEAMALVLHRDGTASFVSEHEPSDLSSSGVGVWERLSRKTIGIGILMYRMSEADPTTVCAIIGVAGPDNCVLRLGSRVRRVAPGLYEGNMLLTIDGPNVPGEETVSVTIEVDLPFSMRRVDLAEFPGAL